MDLESLRDLVVVICGISGIVVTIVLLIIAFLLFGKVRAIVDSSRATVANIRGISRIYVSGAPCPGSTWHYWDNNWTLKKKDGKDTWPTMKGRVLRLGLSWGHLSAPP
jgi:hypothetical protein